jgi:PEP-CTERM motif
MKPKELILCLALLLGGVGQAKAGSILYFTDGTNATDQMAAALATLPYTVTQVSDPTVFATQIATGNYQLGIFSAQQRYGPNYSAALAALASFVQGPSQGKAIVDSWFTPLGSDLAPFGATLTGDVNGPAVNLSDFSAGITNPMAISNQVPQYEVFSDGLSLEPGAFSAGTFFDPGNSSGTNGEVGVAVGNLDSSWEAGGRSIVNGFLTDTAGSPGEQLYINEIDALLTPATPTPTAAPEPATLTMLGIATVFVGGYGWRRRKLAPA